MQRPSLARGWARESSPSLARVTTRQWSHDKFPLHSQLSPARSQTRSSWVSPRDSRAGTHRAETGTASTDAMDVPGATFDGLLNMLARQHHREVEELRSELIELAMSQPMAPSRRATGVAHPPCWAPEEQLEVKPPSRGGARRSSSPPRRSARPSPPGDDSTMVIGVLPGAVPPRAPPICDLTADAEAPQAAGGRAGTEHSGGSASGPRTFELLEAWRATAVELKSHWSRSIFRESSLQFQPRGRAAHERPGPPSSLGERAWLALVVAQPTSPWRVAWHFFGALLILYDLLKLPIEHAFRPDETDFSRVMDWIILLYWTLNMPASLTEGYLEHGVVVLSPRRILARYLRTWFPVDALVLVPDWTFTIGSLIGSSQDRASKAFTRFLNVARLARIVRLVRLLKLRRVLDTLNDMTTSEHTSVLLNILAMIVMLLLISHQIGCAWFAIGDNQEDGTPSWTTSPGVAGRGGWVYMYATSVHWSVSQFTPATVEVSPENLGERVFAIVVVIFALVVFSYIVGSITGSLAQLRSMHAEEANLFWDLRRYLAKNGVTRPLSLRIQKYLEYAWRVQQERKPAKSIRLMCLLSEQLSSELQCELAVAQLQVHPFLARLCDTSSVTAQRLANAGIGHKLVAGGDFLFYPGEAATHLFIVVEGSSEYSRVDLSGNVCREAVKNNEDWIAEPVLWTKWVHRGLLTALEDGDELAIDGKKFGELVRLNPKAHTFASKYAHNFIRWLNDQDPGDLTDVSQGEDVGDLVQSFMCQDGDHDRDSDEGVNMVVTCTHSMTPTFTATC